MTGTAFDGMLVNEDVTLLDALAAIDRGRNGVCLILDSDERLSGLVSDGDVRRALLAGTVLTDRALAIATRAPKTVNANASRAHVLDLMRATRVNAIPAVDDRGRVTAVHTLTDIAGQSPLPNRAVIMAGGKGTRLGELTKHTPKPLMEVAGRSIIEWIILGLIGDGIRSISVSVNHFADQIVDRLGDGSALGCSIEYLREEPATPLGTAGSLTLLPTEYTEASAPPMLVLNGDIMVDFSVRELLAFHEASSARMVMGTKTYQHTVPYGVVEVDDDRKVTRMSEKPDLTVEINAAVYCIDADLIRLLPYNVPSTMPELAQICIDSGRGVAAWPISNDWIDVGTPTDLARAKGETHA